MIALARHGETTWNVSGRYQGRRESDLSPLGARQAMALAGHFAELQERGEPVPEHVVSSPLSRCTETGRYTAERLGIALVTDARLIEIAHGTWEGRYREELERNDPQRYWMWRNDPAHVTFEGGETLHDVMARWRSFATDLVAAPCNPLVVTHDAVVRCALLDVMGKPLDEFWKMRVQNGAFAILAVENGRLALLEECYDAHLRGLRSYLNAQAL